MTKGNIEVHTAKNVAAAKRIGAYLKKEGKAVRYATIKGVHYILAKKKK